MIVDANPKAVAARTPRALPLGVVLGFAIGFSLLVLGLGALFGLMLDERDAALAQIDADRDAVATRATEALRDALGDTLALAEARIDDALRDPLAPRADLLLVEEGAVVLPAPPGAPETRAREILDALARGRLPDDAATPEESERARLVQELPETYAAWLDHRRHFVLRADVDLATTLLALERLASAGALPPERAAALLRASAGTAANDLEGFLPALLRARARLSAADFDALLARAVPLAKRALVRVDDVLARAAERPGAIPSALLPPRWTASPGLLVADDWLARGDAQRVIATRVVRDDLLAQAHQALALDDAITLDARRWSGPLSELRVVATSARWDDARAELQRRFLFKLVPLGTVALLAVVVFLLALVLQRRRAAYLDLRSHLLAAVSHELKTPLASIRAMAETLELRLADHPNARDYPRRIVASSERLEFLVDNVLSFARLEREAWRPEMSLLTLADLAAWLAADPVARAVRPVDLELDVPAGLSLLADRDLVRLLLSNLLDNAAKYATADRVRVRLAARHRDSGAVELEVSDDGPGLGDLDARDLFDDFRRGHVNGVHGTGLGLSICRMVMALHGGSIAVAATSPAGTTFVATFPRGAVAAAVPGREDDARLGRRHQVLES